MNPACVNYSSLWSTNISLQDVCSWHCKKTRPESQPTVPTVYIYPNIHISFGSASLARRSRLKDVRPSGKFWPFLVVGSRWLGWLEHPIVQIVMKEEDRPMVQHFFLLEKVKHWVWIAMWVHYRVHQGTTPMSYIESLHVQVHSSKFIHYVSSTKFKLRVPPARMPSAPCVLAWCSSLCRCTYWGPLASHISNWCAGSEALRSNEQQYMCTHKSIIFADKKAKVLKFLFWELHWISNHSGSENASQWKLKLGRSCWASTPVPKNVTFIFA